MVLLMRTEPTPPIRDDKTRSIVMAVYGDVMHLDVAGPLDVFTMANKLHREQGGGRPLYDIRLVAEQRGPVATDSGIRLLAESAWTAPKDADTLLVPGGPTDGDTAAGLLHWLREHSHRFRRVGSICTGAFLLARAGLLRGRRATTHWIAMDRFRREFPDVVVEEDAIHVRDGRIYTSAGVTAGIDLALALLEEDHGRDLALQAARMLVVYFKRPGGQSQFSARLRVQFRETGPLAESIAWMRRNRERELTVETIAEHAAMSLRNFSRIFRRETGTTPARFLEMLRLEAAVEYLEQTALPLKDIAAKCGFRSDSHFRQTFNRRFGTSPGHYRARFRA